jgi:hypothetical protein
MLLTIRARRDTTEYSIGTKSEICITTMAARGFEPCPYYGKAKFNYSFFRIYDNSKNYRQRLINICKAIDGS